MLRSHSKILALVLLAAACAEDPVEEQSQRAVCGNGRVDDGEQCDDGNLVATDACTDTCRNAACGDGIVAEGTEPCDDGNGIDTDACTSLCQVAICGDGLVRSDTEACDDQNDDPTDGCAACQRIQCGPGFQAEGAGFAPRDLAGDFSIDKGETTWRFSEHFTGCDNFLFVFHTVRASGLVSLWSQPPSQFLPDFPDNTHVIFGSFDADAEAVLQAKAEQVSAWLDSADAQTRARYRYRLHFVRKPLSQADGWLGQIASSAGTALFMVDGEQRVRGVGNPASGNQLSMASLGHELVYLNFEAQRRASMAQRESSLVVPIFDAVAHGGGWGAGARSETWITVPEADQLAGHNRMELDMTMACDDHLEFENCPEWDRLANAYVCDVPIPTDPLDGACQARVPGQEAVPEVLGTCEGTANACGGPADCEDGLGCVGYVPAVAAVPEIPAETISCGCEDPYGQAVNAQARCNDEGTGFLECACRCDAEFGRWVTTYRREGRWVTDVTPFMAFFEAGTRRKIRFVSNNTQPISLSLRFFTEGASSKPIAIQPLFRGRAFTQDYNDHFQPIALEPPEGAQRVELVTYITGHGWGRDVENCAEFCNHTHHFTVGEKSFIRRHPEAGAPTGCEDRVGEGVVPNQYGTWYFGRGGWCPGLDVEPWVVDITEAVGRGAEIRYQAFLRDAPYVPQSSSNPDGNGFDATIEMSSYVVYY